MTLTAAGPSLLPASLPVTPDPAFPIRLIALDIDGTIIGDDQEITTRTIEAVRRAMERDVAVSLVTGRMVSSAMRFAAELGLTGPIVGYQGGLIRAMPMPDTRRLGKLLLHTPLPADVGTGHPDVDAGPRPRSARQPPGALHPARRRPDAPTTTRRSWARGPSSSPTSSKRSTIP